MYRLLCLYAIFIFKNICNTQYSRSEIVHAILRLRKFPDCAEHIYIMQSSAQVYGLWQKINWYFLVQVYLPQFFVHAHGPCNCINWSFLEWKTFKLPTAHMNIAWKCINWHFKARLVSYTTQTSVAQARTRTAQPSIHAHGLEWHTKWCFLVWKYIK